MKYISLIWMIIITFLSAEGQTLPNSQKDGQYYEVNGAKIWVVTFGTGDPLFIIPGGPGSAHIGYRTFDSLASTCKLVYYDGFGRGKSDTAKDVRQYSLDRDIEDLEGLRKAMHLDMVNVLGHSYGGLVAQGYAIKYPQHLKHLVLANTFHSFVMWQKNDDNSNHEIKTNYPEVWDSLMAIRDKGYVSSDPIHQRLYGTVPYGFLYAYNPDNFRRRGSGFYPNRYNAKLYYQMVGKDGDFIVGSDIGNFDFRTKLKSLAMPILIYGGRFDRVAVPEMMIKYKQYCPQAKFVIFEFSGHNPQIEEPQLLFPMLRKFLKE